MGWGLLYIDDVVTWDDQLYWACEDSSRVSHFTDRLKLVPRIRGTYPFVQVAMVKAGPWRPRANLMTSFVLPKSQAT